MKHGTRIEWTHVPGYKGETWNPVGGCSHASAGCRNCYAERLAARLQAQGHPVYAGVVAPSKRGPKFTGRLAQAPDDSPVWYEPLRWRKPRAIFVADMSDLFHEDRADSSIDRVFDIAGQCPEHIFMLLTKRAARMRACLERFRPSRSRRPLPNVWLGVSVEDQKTADERIPDLLGTPAAVRFISYEPALGPVDFSRWLPIAPRGQGWEPIKCEAAYGEKRPRLNWVIAGGESGPHARPPHPDWFRSARDQCAAAGVPFFFKQWGEWAPCPDDDGDYEAHRRRGARDIWCPPNDPHTVMELVGKKRAGRLLDGIEHSAFPVSRDGAAPTGRAALAEISA